MADQAQESTGRPANEALAAAGWFVVAILARAPLVARIEGTLDHDQSVVGLMALDIARGRRFPIFFDGQRYMGAVEAYIAAAFVRIFGHAPTVIALAPLLAFGLFAASQFVVWSRWRDRATGHLAAALTVLCAPMLVLWAIVPRGGYVEFLAWALPTLALYRTLCRPGCPVPRPAFQAAWGFWLMIGYFLNPFSLTVYATIALDWTFGRHGSDLRREHNLAAHWLDHRAAPMVVLGIAAAWLMALAACCHVDPRAASEGVPYVGLGGLFGPRIGLALGAVGVLAILGLSAWWSRGPARVFGLVMRYPAAVVGVFAALSPILTYNLLVRLGVYPPAFSLPIWITAPWKAGPNLKVLLGALGTLVGSDPRAIQTVLIGSGVEVPAARWPAIESALIAFSPVVVAVVVGIVLFAAAREGPYWSRLLTLRGNDVAPPVALAAGFLAVAAGLFLLQGSSPNPSSIRYLVPFGVVLPGLMASGLRAIPGRVGVVAGLVLFVPWLAAQSQIWGDLDRPSPARPLAAELTRRGVTAIVAQTQVALIVANLTHGAVGAVEYQAMWPRLGDRYAARLPRDRPLTCVVDLRFPWDDLGVGAWGPEQDLGLHLRGLSRRYPGLVKSSGRFGSFEIWEVALPVGEVLAREPVDDRKDRRLAINGR